MKTDAASRTRQHPRRVLVGSSAFVTLLARVDQVDNDVHIFNVVDCAFVALSDLHPLSGACVADDRFSTLRTRGALEAATANLLLGTGDAKAMTARLPDGLVVAASHFAETKGATKPLESVFSRPRGSIH